MDVADNPFAPGAGTQPPELTGRDENLELARVTLERIRTGKSDRSSLLIGLRGVGKTVLLNRIQEKAEKSGGYCSVLIESPEGKPLAELLAPCLRKILLRLDAEEGAREKRHQAMVALHSFASVFKVKIGEVALGVEAPSGVADSGVLEHDLRDLLVVLGEAAKEAEVCVVVLIDELQYVAEKELAALFSGIHRIGQLNLPLVIFGAGLPQLAALSGEAKSYAERLFAFQTIGRLNKDDAKKAIKDPLESEGVKITEEALEEIVTLTEGYPYFLQEWGSQVWKHAERSPITLADVRNASRDAVAALDNGFFKVRFERLSPSEKDYLRAMAELGRGPHRSSAIAKKLGRTVDQVAQIRSQVITKGMVYAPAYGDTAFTVPKFDEYMKRVMPDFAPHVPQKRKRKK